MPIPYRRPAAAKVQAAIAYLCVVRASDGAYLGALLLTDALGRPVEFVHNRVETPRGFMWPGDQVREAAVTALCHSLFDACTREPVLLLAEGSLGSAEFCRDTLAPLTPFALLSPTDWVWISRPPAPGSDAQTFAEELRARGDPLEPFTRVQAGLREVYPDARWD